jgi:hypothetical protein
MKPIDRYDLIKPDSFQPFYSQSRGLPLDGISLEDVAEMSAAELRYLIDSFNHNAYIHSRETLERLDMDGRIFINSSSNDFKNYGFKIGPCVTFRAMKHYLGVNSTKKQALKFE